MYIIYMINRDMIDDLKIFLINLLNYMNIQCKYQDTFKCKK